MIAFPDTIARRDIAPTPPAGEDDRERIGRVLEGRYDMLRTLGGGGMSTVYLACDPELDRLVAVKVLAPAFRVIAEERERFRQEARLLASIDHPNVVGVHEFGGDGDFLYYVMPFVPGETLADCLERTDRLPIDTTREILLSLTSALDAVHALGVVHRDVKPENVLLEAGTGRPVLIDFGVARLKGIAELPGRAVGTPDYMAPEQAVGDAACDARADIYALGVLGFRMLAGRLPFLGDTPRAVLAKHVTQQAPRLSPLAPRAPRDLVAAIERCLRKEPSARWQGAPALRRALIAGRPRLPFGRELANTRDWVSRVVPAGLSALAAFVAS